MNIGDVILRLGLETGTFEQDVVKAGERAGAKAGTAMSGSLGSRLSAGLARSGKAMAAAGASLTRNVTVPIVGLGAAVWAVGEQFDTTLRQIVALTDATADEIGGIRAAILSLSGEVGKTPQELAEGFYFLASAGFDTAEALEVLKSTAKASAVGLGTTADISRVVGAAINAFGKDNLTAADAVDQLIRAVKDGTAEAPEFAGALGDVLGSAGQVGSNFADVTAAIAAMTLKGISADEAATSLNQVFVSLIKTTPKADKALDGMGLSAEGLRRQLREEGLLSVLQTLSDKFAGNETAAAEVFGNIRALRGILALTSGDAEATAALFEDVASGTTTLADAFEETEGPGRSFDRAMARIQVVLIKLGDDVLPVVAELLDKISAVVSVVADAFKALPGPLRTGTVGFLALAAVTGPLLFGFGKITSGAGLVVSALMKLGPAGHAAAKVGTVIAGALGKGMASATGPLSTGLATALDKAGVSGPVSKATGGLGKLLGSKLGKGLAVGFAAVAVFEVFQTWQDISAGLDEQMAGIGKSAGEQIKTGTLAELKAGRAAVAKGIEDLGGLWWNPFAGGQKEKLQAQLDAYDAAITKAAAGTGPALAGGIAAGAGSAADAAGDLADGVVDELDGIPDDATAAGAATSQNLAAGILDQQDDVDAALEALRTQTKEELSKTAEVAKLIGILTSTELMAGLRDGRPGVRAQAEATRTTALERLKALEPTASDVGKNAATALAAGLASKNATVRANAEATKAIVDGSLSATAGTENAGAATGQAYADGLRAKYGAVLAAAYLLYNTQTKILRGRKPPDPRDPNAPGRASGGPTVAGVPYVVGELGPELFVPRVAGSILSHAETDRLAAGGSAGDTINITVPIQGVLRAESPFAVARELQRFASFGVFQPRRAR